MGGRRLTACGRVTLTTTNTERSGASTFRIATGSRNGRAEIVLAFDRPVTGVDLTVRDVRVGDTLGDFNVGSPPRLSGGLLQTADGRVTAGAGNTERTSRGTLSWPELDAGELRLSLRHEGKDGDASISVESFRIACRTSPARGSSP